jgi:signal transduction histidine kinase
LHGGDIDIRSEKGVGTKISLLFSADRVKNP